MIAGLIQHFQSGIFEAWKLKVSSQRVWWEGFWSHQLLLSSHLRECDKMLLRSILSGGVWKGFFQQGKTKGEDVKCRFCGGQNGDGHLLWDCTFLPIVNVREPPEFLPLSRRDGSNWPRCLLSDGWLLGFGWSGERASWADSVGFLCSCRRFCCGCWRIFLLPSWQCGVLPGVSWQNGVARWIGAVSLCWSPDLFTRSRGQNFGALSWPCKLSGLCIWVLRILMLLKLLPSSWNMVDSHFLSNTILWS